MAKPDRNPKRRVQRRSKNTVSSGQTKVCLVTAPTSNQGLSLANDVELAKAAVLYADSVEMIGLSVALFERLRQLTRQPYGMLRWYLDLDDESFAHVTGGRDIASFQGPDWRERARKVLNHERYRTSNPARWAQSLDWLGGLEEVELGARPLVDNIISSSGADELAAGVDAGVIRVADLDVTMSNLYRPAAMRETNSEAAVAAWVNHIISRLADRRYRMIFDSESASLVSELVRMGKVEQDEQARRLTGQASLGSGLVASLPAFPAAKMNQLLDLRSELAVPVATYQAAVMQYARELPADVEAGPDLQFEIRQIYEARVRPAILEIEESITNSGFLCEIPSHVSGRDLGIFATGATVSTYLGATGNVGDLTLAAVGSAASAVPALAEAAKETFQARRERKNVTSSREFYLLYEANRRFAAN